MVVRDDTEGEREVAADPPQVRDERRLRELQSNDRRPQGRPQQRPPIGFILETHQAVLSSAFPVFKPVFVGGRQAHIARHLRRDSAIHETLARHTLRQR
jgi:hypothetical protein